MSSSFTAAEGSVYLSNRRFDTLISLAIDVAQSIAVTQAEMDSIDSLAKEQRQMYNGYDLVIEEQFRSVEDRNFWARVFEELASRLTSEAIGNADPPYDWRAGAYKDAKSIAALLSIGKA